MSAEDSRGVGGDTVFVIPVGPNCQADFVSDTIESVRHFAPLARIVVVDDSRRALGAELGERYEFTNLLAGAHGLLGSLYLNLSDGFKEALTQPFQVLVRLDTDALISGSDFEIKAIKTFNADPSVGSLGSFRVGYNCIGIRDTTWAKRRLLTYLATRGWRKPRQAQLILGLLRRARKHGYKLGDSIMGGAAVYRYDAVVALDESGLLGRPELAEIGLQEDHLFGLCLLSLGFQLGEFGNQYDDLPMGVDWKGLPAAPSELIELGKSIIHSTKRFEAMDERTIRQEFRSARLGS
jgi:hypothetical protein